MANPEINLIRQPETRDAEQILAENQATALRTEAVKAGVEAALDGADRKTLHTHAQMIFEAQQQTSQ